MGGSIDWKAAREFLRWKIAGKLDRADPQVVEDLVQTALVKLYEYAQDHVIDNVEAFMTTLAHRVYVDFVRQRRVWSLLVQRQDDDTPEPVDAGPPPDHWGDPVQRIELMVKAHFAAKAAPCLELAEHYFRELDWTQVAERLSRSYAAVRKQWSRCIAELRLSIAAQDGPFGEWAAHEGLIPS